jgi:hypothetical protein
VSFLGSLVLSLVAALMSDLEIPSLPIAMMRRTISCDVKGCTWHCLDGKWTPVPPPPRGLPPAKKTRARWNWVWIYDSIEDV